MRKDAKLLWPLGFMTVLCSVVLATPTRQYQLVEMSVQVMKGDEVVIAEESRLIPGQDPGGPTIVVAPEVPGVPDAPDWAGTVGATTTFEAEHLAQYAVQLRDPWYVIEGDTLWWTKMTAFLYIDKTAGDRATVDVIAKRTRDDENYAVYAVAPGSATGFVNDTGLPPSAGGGNPIRLFMEGWFWGGDYSSAEPSFFYGDGFFDTYGEPPGPTFNETIIEYNQGFALIVDLNAANVQIGEEYQFRQLYALGTGPGVSVNDFDDLNLAFVKIDPIVGYATMIPFTGDLNEDGFVGQFDLDIVLAQWGNSGDEITDPRADPSGDNFVGQTDLDYVLAMWGLGTPPEVSVPEPATLGMFALCGLALLRRKPKSR